MIKIQLQLPLPHISGTSFWLMYAIICRLLRSRYSAAGRDLQFNGKHTNSG